MNRLIKYIIQNMGSNLTEASLQRAARSVSTLHAIYQTFDVESGVPYGTHDHSTRSDSQDVTKVVGVVMQSKLLTPTAGRRHVFPTIHLDPLHNWDIQKAKGLIERKKQEHLGRVRLGLHPFRWSSISVRLDPSTVFSCHSRSTGSIKLASGGGGRESSGRTFGRDGRDGRPFVCQF